MIYNKNNTYVENSYQFQNKQKNMMGELYVANNKR